MRCEVNRIFTDEVCPVRMLSAYGEKTARRTNESESTSKNDQVRKRERESASERAREKIQEERERENIYDNDEV